MFLDKAKWRHASRAQSEIIQLAWPIASAMLGETIMGLVDTKLVAGLGAPALGGVGVASSLFYLSFVTLLGLMRGVKVCTSHAVGRGQATHGVRYAQSGVALGLLAGALFGLLFAYAGGVMRAIGINGNLVPHAMAFLQMRAWGLPAACATLALVEHRQGVGDVRSPMLVGLVGNVLNAALAYGLIYGHFGLPALGVRGAGLGTTLTEFVQLGLMLSLLVAGQRRRRGVGPPVLLSYGQACRELLRVGLPTALHFFCETLALVCFTAILGGLSDADVAAHQIGSAINRLAYLFGAAIGEAACITVGRSLGAQRLDDADRSVRAAVRVASLFMAVAGVVFLFCGGMMARLFTHDPQVTRIVVRLLWIAGVWQVLDAYNVVMRASLRAAKDVRAAAVIGITILWTCVPTAVYVLGKLAGWGVVGGWVGCLLGCLLSATLFSRRWYRGAWRRTFVVPQEVAGAAPCGTLVSRAVGA